MELSRQEYPALLTTLQPAQAVSVLGDRVRLIAKINADIADWLCERRRVEELYVQGLKKLASRRHQDGALSLGVFQIPWQNIVSATESLANSHATLAQKIEVDVERPLREYQTKNREMQGISTIQGNLSSLAKELEESQKKSEKVLAKGGKADTGKVSSAISNVQDANQQWDSQAPFVFEQLQALDENRVNHLRDVLTQLQTHEVDQLERSRVSSENCLNSLLEVDTADEISNFVARTSGSASSTQMRRPARNMSSGTSTTPMPHSSTILSRPPTNPQQSFDARSSTLAPPGHELPRSVEDGRSERSTVSGGVMKPPSTTEKKKGAMGGLRRLGTVMSRRKNDSKPTERTSSPEKQPKSSRNPLRRGPSSRNMQQIPSPEASMTELPTSPPRGQTPVTHESFQGQPPQSNSAPLDQWRREPDVNGDIIEPAIPRDSALTNGTKLPQVNVPEFKPRPPSTIQEEGDRDPEGYSVPPSAVDDITRAQQEALADSDQQQFKLNIKNEPIREEDGDAQAAMSNVANTLRAQALIVPPQRKAGTLRGRRDVRNTIFVPNPSTAENFPVSELGMAPVTPTNLPRVGTMPTEETRGADTQSIRSSHSLSSISQNAVRHPDMHEPGLNASIIETVSAWFTEGQVSRAVVVGEVGLVYNGSEISQTGTETIRLENFPVLEKVAPNPAFIHQVAARSGEYTVDLAQIGHTSLAFKYQVHLDQPSLAAHCPFTITPVWKVEPQQTSVILHYGWNNNFLSPVQRSVTLQNVVVTITLEVAKALTCLSKPVGHFSKEKNMVYWRLGSIELDGYADSPQKLLARFTTEGEAKPGIVDVRWEISGQAAVGRGSGLGVSHASGTKEEGGDPFADDGTVGAAGGAFKEVPVVRKIMSGKYIAH